MPSTLFLPAEMAIRFGRSSNVFAASCKTAAEHAANNWEEFLAWKVLIACEHSGTTREAFRSLGHDAWSCDLLPASDASPFHIVGDALEVCAQPGWEIVIVHPPCTYLSVSGQHWCSRGRIEADGKARTAHRAKALAFVRKLWSLPIAKLCMENPVGILNTALPFLPAPQYVQPYQFGDDASKKTGLWRRGLDPLTIDPAARFPGRIVTWEGKQVERWSNQTDSGQNALAPSPLRGHLRSITYPGIALAMALQWSADSHSFTLKP